jgi:hypothetical protein
MEIGLRDKFQDQTPVLYLEHCLLERFHRLDDWRREIEFSGRHYRSAIRQAKLGESLLTDTKLKRKIR